MILAVLIAAIPALGTASEPLRAVFADWSVFAPNDEALCWISTTPMKSETTRGGVLAADNRDTYLIFTYDPFGKGIAEMSYAYGRAFDPGSNIRFLAPLAGFDMFQQDGWAWLRESGKDRALIQAVRHAEIAGLPLVIATGSPDSQTSDSFSAHGFAAAMQDAKARCP